MHAYTTASLYRAKSIARFACVAGLTAVLTCGPCLAYAPRTAFGATSETTAELSSLTQQVNDAAATYQEAAGKVEELNQEISDKAAEILEYEQTVLPEQKEKASEAVCNLYKMKTSSSGLISMLLSSSSLGDLITQVKYLATIQDENTEELERLNAAHDELESKMTELSEAKEEAESEQNRASEALSSAQSAQAEMEKRAQSEDAQEAEAARKAAEAAAATTASMQASAVSASTSVSSTSETSSSGSTSSQSQSGSQQSSSSSSSTSQSSSSGSSSSSISSSGSSSSSSSSGSSTGSSSSSSGTGEWKSGVASYYGIGDGFMGGTTASGAIVTETSMGVAMLNVPLGTYVEISYGGKSVIAVVNDRGPYVHGRVIDMQPAVARALGFLSVGVGTVQYRFL